MDVSDLSSDWDVVNSTSAGDFEELLRERSSESALQQDGSVDAAVMEKVTKGSCVDDIAPELDTNALSDSNSSSDIDVIDENALEDSHSSISIPSMEFSLSSSMDGFKPSIPLPSFPDTVNEQVTSDTQETSKDQTSNAPLISEDSTLDEDLSTSTDLMNEINRDVSPRLYDFSILERIFTDPWIKRCFVIFFLFIMTVFMLLDCPLHLVRQMEERVTILQAENSKLKNQVSSKIEVEQKPLLVLEEEIKSLKSENVKLSNCMKDLIFQMEEQNTLFKKENEARERELYKNEIDRLKEQINILQIDNEELQKQLVRVRYGIYSPHAKDFKEDKMKGKHIKDEGEIKEKFVEGEKRNVFMEDENKLGHENSNVSNERKNNDGEDNNKMEVKVNKDTNKTGEKSNEKQKEVKDKSSEEKNDNSTEILTNEIKELRRKLYSEVEKLKNWKESVQHLMEKLKHHPEEVKFENEKYKSGRGESSEHMKSPNEEEPQYKKGHKKEKKFYEWNLSDLQNNLKSTMENLHDIKVPEFISQYVNVDRKKMKGVFESVGHYFKKAQEKTKKMFDYKDKKENEVWNFLGDLRRKWHEMKKEFFKDDHKKSHPSEKTHFYKKGEPMEDQKPQFHKVDKNLEDYETQSDANNENYKNHRVEREDDLNGDPKHPQPAFSKDFENEGSRHKSWLFKRAEYRSELRDEEEEELSTNWFLRKKKEPFSINQNDHENENEDAFL